MDNDRISDREQYKYWSSKPTALEAKKEAAKIIQEKQLSSVMNDTKWLRLLAAISRLPFPPPFVEKLVFDDTTYDQVKISDAPDWLGDWTPAYQEGMGWFFAIEFIKVRPRFAEFQGQLGEPKITDATHEFRQLLNELHIPFEEENGTFTIYGYK